MKVLGSLVLVAAVMSFGDLVEAVTTPVHGVHIHHREVAAHLSGSAARLARRKASGKCQAHFSQVRSTSPLRCSPLCLRMTALLFDRIHQDDLYVVLKGPVHVFLDSYHVVHAHNGVHAQDDVHIHHVHAHYGVHAYDLVYAHDLARAHDAYHFVHDAHDLDPRPSACRYAREGGSISEPWQR
jgi:hypothetical protein